MPGNVVWDPLGYEYLTGKEAFDQGIENENFIGSPELTVDRLVDETDTVVAIGVGEGMLTTGAPFRFGSSTVLIFAGDIIRRVESFAVPLTAEA